jgi:hypothetical protein
VHSVHQNWYRFSLHTYVFIVYMVHSSLLWKLASVKLLQNYLNLFSNAHAEKMEVRKTKNVKTVKEPKTEQV